jgi:hypothetical protein
MGHYFASSTKVGWKTERVVTLKTSMETCLMHLVS